MNSHHPHAKRPQTSVRTSSGIVHDRVIRYSAMLLTVLLCACSSQSWRSSSGMWSDPKSGKVANPAAQGSNTVGRTTSLDTPAGSAAANSTDFSANRAQADQAVGAGGNTQDGAMGANSQGGSEMPEEAGMGGRTADEMAAAEAARNQAAGAEDLSGLNKWGDAAEDHGSAARSGSGDTFTAALPPDDSATTGAGGAEMQGIPGEAQWQAEEASAGSEGTAGNEAESATSLSAEGTAQAEQTPQDEVVVGMVDTPGNKATSTEVVIPQTLGGLLPLTVGVEGEGEFDFDQAVLRNHVKSALDELATKLKDAQYDRLEIVGHTDRIGAEDYNQYLSERRAWAVARYLVQQGVPANKLAVEGRGMHEPMTARADCMGLDRDQTITCLQRDRRVVISASIRKVDVNVH